MKACYPIISTYYAMTENSLESGWMLQTFEDNVTVQ